MSTLEVVEAHEDVRVTRVSVTRVTTLRVVPVLHDSPVMYRYKLEFEKANFETSGSLYNRFKG
jgi:hypothetical protein